MQCGAKPVRQEYAGCSFYCRKDGSCKIPNGCIHQEGPPTSEGLRRTAGYVEWISVKDKVPAKNQTVLVTDGVHIVVVEFVSYEGGMADVYPHGFSGYEWEWDFDERFITHWMPLPDKPNSI